LKRRRLADRSGPPSSSSSAPVIIGIVLVAVAALVLVVAMGGKDSGLSGKSDEEIAEEYMAEGNAHYFAGLERAGYKVTEKDIAEVRKRMDKAKPELVERIRRARESGQRTEDLRDDFKARLRAR